MPEALYLFATCAMQQQDWTTASDALQRYLAIQDRDAGAHSMRGVALQFLGDMAGAQHHMQMAVRLEPQAAEHHYNLGKLLRGTGQLEAAAAAYAEALRLRPLYPEALNNRGEVLLALGLAPEAYQAARDALAASPGMHEALITLGGALAAMNRPLEALEAFDRALAAKPDAIRARLGRGLALAALGRSAEARATLEPALATSIEPGGNSEQYAAALRVIRRHDEALRIIDGWLGSHPDQPRAHNLRGLILADLHRPLEALAAYDKAIALRPGFTDALVNRGNACLMVNDIDSARLSFDEALGLEPQNGQAHWNRCLSDLLAGDYVSGWSRYNWRWSVPAVIERPSLDGPLWTGAQKVEELLVWEEQGLGDQILFASLLPELNKTVRRLILAPSSKLVPLFARSFPESLVMPLAKAVADFSGAPHLPFGDLARILRPTPPSFPENTSAYLASDHQRRDSIRSMIWRPGHLVCGLSWRSVNETIGREKSMALEALVPLLDLPRLLFVNLQYGDISGDLAGLPPSHSRSFSQVPDVDLWNDIDGVAALADACDVIVTTSNTTAHIAGGLGKKVLLMVPYALGRSWYWAARNGRSIWYPDLHVFRQPRDGDWTSVIGEVRVKLEQLLNSTPPH